MLLDCLSLLVSNLLLAHAADPKPAMQHEIEALLASVQERDLTLVPAVGARRSHDVTCGRGVQQAPDRQETCRQRGKGSHGDRHRPSVTKRCKKGVWGGRPGVPAR